MMKSLSACVALFILLSISQAFGGDTDPMWLIIPGVKVGPILPDTSESDLIKLYGKANIKNEKIYLYNEGEETEIGTVIYPNDPQKKLTIIWKDPDKRNFLKRVEFYGDKSYWKTSEGVSLGTSLKELQQINEHNFIFWGFGWDGSGYIKSWENGKLEKYSHVIDVRLSDFQNPNVKRVSKEEYDSLIGEREVNSASKVAQKVNPTVRNIYINFE